MGGDTRASIALHTAQPRSPAASMDTVKRAFMPADSSSNHSRQTNDADKDLKNVESVPGSGEDKQTELNPEAQKDLQQLRTTLQNNIQTSRMQHHAFEALSLPGSQPVSRVSSACSILKQVADHSLAQGAFWNEYTA